MTILSKVEKGNGLTCQRERQLRRQWKLKGNELILSLKNWQVICIKLRLKTESANGWEVAEMVPSGLGSVHTGRPHTIGLSVQADTRRLPKIIILGKVYILKIPLVNLYTVLGKCSALAGVFIFHVLVFCLHVCLCLKCVAGACRSQQRPLDHLAVEPERVVSCSVQAGKGIQVLWKNSLVF